jgi:hypothetical protein
LTPFLSAGVDPFVKLIGKATWAAILSEEFLIKESQN